MSSKSANKNPDLDFRKINNGETVKTEFPTTIDDEFRVYFAESAYRDMMAHANMTTEVELGGILLGDVCSDSRGAFLKISAVIEGKHSNNYGTQITFTHNTWQHINEIKDSKHPEKRIVGWYHTHPGFGIFLSEMDYFIQENFFNQPYQIAVVIETKDNKEGAFVWENGRCIPLSRYWTGNREVKLATGKAEQFSLAQHAAPCHMHTQEEGQHERRGGGAASASDNIIVMGMTLILVVLTFFVGMYWGKGAGMMELEKKMVQTVQSELFSILEYASLNTGAKLDFESVEVKVKEAEKALKADKKKDAAEILDETGKYLETLKGTYSANREQFRNDLRKLQDAKGSLANQISQYRNEQELINYKLADMYLLRIKQMIVESRVPFSKMSAAEQYFIRSNLAWIMQTCPGMKAAVEHEFPEIFNIMYQKTSRHLDAQ